MLASYLVSLTPHRPGPVSANLGRALHGMMFRLVAESRPELAERLHAGDGLRPFTVSALNGRWERDNGRRIAIPDERYTVRFTSLSDELTGTLSHVLLERLVLGRDVGIDHIPFHVAAVTVDPGLSRGWADLSDFDRLLANASVADRVRLRFASPTTFRAGDVNLIFPLPESVFGSYLRKWNTFAPEPLDGGIQEFARQHVVAERYELGTRAVPFGRDAQHIGCVGDCQYRILSDDLAARRLINALADFALYCGTGQKSTQGLGQTRRVEPLP